MPEYHNKLGLVYESADRLQDACAQYAAALELAPHNYHFISNYARARVRIGEVTPESRSLLEQVVFHDPRPEWKDWARQQLTQSHLDVPPLHGWSQTATPHPASPQPAVPLSSDPPVRIKLP